jgi:hypothetical protein
MTKVDRVEVEMFSTVPNNAIVRTPGRRFPGNVVQGDSLSILVKHSSAVLRMAERIGDPDLLDEATGLHELLEARLRHYEAVLQEHGLKLPYFE